MKIEIDFSSGELHPNEALALSDFFRALGSEKPLNEIEVVEPEIVEPPKRKTRAKAVKAKEPVKTDKGTTETAVKPNIDKQTLIDLFTPLFMPSTDPNKMANKKKVRGKLTEMGAARFADLPTEKYQEFYDFLTNTKFQ